MSKRVTHTTSEENAGPTPAGEVPVNLTRFLTITRIAFIVAIGLTAVTLVLCGLAMIGKWEPRCAERQWGQGYRTRDFLAWPLGSVVITTGIGRALWAGMRERLRQHFETYNMEVYRFASMRITFAELTSYGGLCAMILGLGLILGISITHCYEILVDCFGLTISD